MNEWTGTTSNRPRRTGPSSSTIWASAPPVRPDRRDQDALFLSGVRSATTFLIESAAGAASRGLGAPLCRCGRAMGPGTENPYSGRCVRSSSTWLIRPSASLVDLPEPGCPVRTGPGRGDHRRHLRQRLHLFAHNTALTHADVDGIVPFVLGHEIAGRVIEAGPESPCRSDEVAWTLHPCRPGASPVCTNCARAGRRRASRSTAGS